MLAILLACAAMALKDGLGTMLVIAEARGRAVLAGLLDAGSDLALVLVTLAGVGQVIYHGWSAHTVLVLAGDAAHLIRRHPVLDPGRGALAARRPVRPDS